MVLLLAAWLMGFQPGTSQNATALSAQAVLLQVTMPSGSVNRLTIQVGKHGSVGAVGGPSLDLSPALNDDGSLALAVTPTVWDAATQSFSIGEPERAGLRIGEAASFARDLFPITVKWLETKTAAAPGGASPAGTEADRCCVVCNSEVTCGCAVVTPCGNCCVEPCPCQNGSVKRFELE
jgi:hypothetical protein